MTSLDSPVIDRPSGRVGHPSEVTESEETTEEWFTDGASFAMASQGPISHDPSPLLEALAEIEARRAALEWLLEQDLLRLCLI